MRSGDSERLLEVTGREYGGDFILMRDTYWKPTGYDAQSGGDAAVGGRDCGRRYA